MTAEQPATRDEIDALAAALLAGETEELVTARRPVHWPSLTAVELAAEWPHLLAWVQLLKVRYPNSLRLPDCWWRHADLVEPLAALRDYEHGCFAVSSDPRTAVDWQRAFRDIDAQLELSVRRLPCASGVRGHVAPPSPHIPAGWLDYVDSVVHQPSAPA